MKEKKRLATAEEAMQLALECGRLADLVVEVSSTHLAGPLARCIAILLEEFSAGHHVPVTIVKPVKDKAAEYGMSKRELEDLEKMLAPGYKSTGTKIPAKKSLADLQRILDDIKKKKR